MYNIENILSCKHCEEIFKNDVIKNKEIYKILVKQFHPDINNDSRAEQAFKNIQTLYDEAKMKIKNGTWQTDKKIYLTSISGKKVSLKYLSVKSFELGKIYIADTHILYLIDKKYKRYYENAIKQIKSLKYKDSDMKNIFEKLVPKIKDSFETSNGEYVIVLTKSPNEYMLSDLLIKNKSKLTDRHVAWIISRLNNINCFLSYNNIVHNGITVDNCFINPDNHTISLYGGWWYSVLENQKMIGTTSEIFSIMPIKNKTEKIASRTTDTESIKYLAKKILYNEKSTPKPFIYWLNLGASNNAIEDFKSWDDALIKSYGKRTFVSLDISKENIY